VYEPNRSAGLEMRMRSFRPQSFEGCMKLFGYRKQKSKRKEKETS